MTQLLRFHGSMDRNPAVERWFDAQRGELGEIARRWFNVMRKCGHDVREVLHDGHPTACIDDAAFGYVSVFTSHVNVGFFRGAALGDPAGLLIGTGKFMRHVKLQPAVPCNPNALADLINAAYVDMKKRVQAELADTQVK